MRVLIRAPGGGVVSEEESPHPDEGEDRFEVVRHEADPGYGQPGAVAGGLTDCQPLLIITGIDGGCVRNRRDETCNFGVIVGQSGAAGRSGRCSGPLRSRDERPGRRLCGVPRAQSPPVTQYAQGPVHRNPLGATAPENRPERIEWRLRHGDIRAWRAALSGVPQE